MQTEVINHLIGAYCSKSTEGFNLMAENNIYERNILNLIKEIKENEKKIEENRKR